MTIRFACGVSIPNGHFASKTDGLGYVGIPDGWAASSRWATDLNGAGAAQNTFWVPARRGAGGSYPSAYPWGDGRGLAVKIKNTLTAQIDRYLQSAVSPAGELAGAEMNDPFGLGTADHWYFRIRCLFRGFGNVPPDATVTLQLYTQDATGFSTSVTGAQVVITAAQWDGTWRWLSSAVNISQIAGAWTSAYVRVFVNNGPAAGTSWAVFDQVTVETLGPVDGSQVLGGDPAPTLAAEGNGGTYYELSRQPKHDGIALGEPETFGKLTRLPSGALMRYDPSGGVQKRSFTFPCRVQTEVDREKLYRLWKANRGYGVNGAIGYGLPVPILLMPIHPNFLGGVLVDFDHDVFPMTIDGGFEASPASAQLWQGELRFLER